MLHSMIDGSNVKAQFNHEGDKKVKELQKKL